MVYLPLFEGFLWFVIKIFYSLWSQNAKVAKKKVNNCNEGNYHKQHCYWLVDHLSSKRWHIYVPPRSYISMSDTLTMIALIAQTTLKFINNPRYKILGIVSLNRKELESVFWHLKAILSLLQFKTPLSACFNLVLVFKDISP